MDSIMIPSFSAIEFTADQTSFLYEVVLFLRIYFYDNSRIKGN